MFQNMMSPSQVYQSLFRTLPIVPQPTATSSASSATFLVENLLREGQSAFINRPVTSLSLPTSGLGLPAGMVMASNPASGRSQEQVTAQVSSASINNVTPYLKFGVNAILGSDTTNSKSSEYQFFPIYHLKM